MNRNDLQNILLQRGIREDVYTLYGGHPSERFVLSQEGQKWAVFYSERGEEVGRREFQSEEEACLYFLERLLQDPLVYQKTSTDKPK